jgi:hypothetical protein
MSADPTLYTEAEATWSPAKAERIGPWTIRTGLGGGQRVSAATLDGDFDPSAIEMAEDAMAALNQPPLFMVKDGQDAFDAELDARGYQIVDPVVILRGDIDTLAVPPEPITAFTVWPPLQIMLDIWDAGGIGPARINVMERSCDPKTSILAAPMIVPPVRGLRRSMAMPPTSMPSPLRPSGGGAGWRST